MCELGPAGVASVISAVETLPVALPLSRAISMYVRNPAFEPGTFVADDGPCERRPSIVRLPVDHAVAVGAESPA